MDAGDLKTLADQIVESLKQAYDDHFGPRYQIHILLSQNPKYRLIILDTQNYNIQFTTTTLHLPHQTSIPIQSQSLDELIRKCLAKQKRFAEEKVLHIFSYSEDSPVKFEPVGILCSSLRINRNLQLQLRENDIDSNELTIQVCERENQQLLLQENERRQANQA